MGIGLAGCRGGRGPVHVGDTSNKESESVGGWRPLIIDGGAKAKDEPWRLDVRVQPNLQISIIIRYTEVAQYQVYIRAAADGRSAPGPEAAEGAGAPPRLPDSRTADGRPDDCRPWFCRGSRASFLNTYISK